MRNLSRPTLIAIVLFGLVVLLLFGFWLSQRGRPEQDRLSDAEVEQGSRPLDDAEKRCGSQRTYELIKRDLFRRAAEIRGSDRAAFDRLTAASSVRMESPSVAARNPELDSVSCSGRLSLDLPPGVAVVGGRRTLASDVDYSVQLGKNAEEAIDATGVVPDTFSAGRGYTKLVNRAAHAIYVPLESTGQWAMEFIRVAVAGTLSRVRRRRNG